MLLDAAGRSNSKAAAELLPMVCDQLRALAAQRTAREPAGLAL